MKKQQFALCTIGFVLAASSAMASPIRIDFTVFPGADNIIGTADDIHVPLTPSSSGGLQDRITNQFAFLNGGVGVVVDSLCCSGGLGNGLGSITQIGGQNVLEQARPDISSTAGSVGPVAFDFVSSSDGHTPVTVTSVDIRVNAGTPGFIQFFDAHGGLRAQFSVPHVAATNVETFPDGSSNILYSDSIGLSRVVFQGNAAVNLFEFDAAAPLTAPPPPAQTPEPGTLANLALGLLMVTAYLGTRRKPAR